MVITREKIREGDAATASMDVRQYEEEEHPKEEAQPNSILAFLQVSRTLHFTPLHPTAAVNSKTYNTQPAEFMTLTQLAPVFQVFPAPFRAIGH